MMPNQTPVLHFAEYLNCCLSEIWGAFFFQAAHRHILQMEFNTSGVSFWHSSYKVTFWMGNFKFANNQLVQSLEAFWNSRRCGSFAFENPTRVPQMPPGLYMYLYLNVWVKWMFESAFANLQIVQWWADLMDGPEFANQCTTVGLFEGGPEFVNIQSR